MIPHIIPTDAQNRIFIVSLKNMSRTLSEFLENILCSFISYNLIVFFGFPGNMKPLVQNDYTAVCNTKVLPENHNFLVHPSP